MLHKHLPNIKCPLCKSSEKWKVDGSSNDHHITEGVISCNNNHNWVIKQEILRLDKENSDENVIYSEREKTGYPKEVNESERSEFLDYIEKYFQNINFDKNTVVINGDPILFYRYFNDVETTYITVKNDEKLLRQLHETIVQKRLFNHHSFIRADMVDSSSANHFHIFKTKKDISLNPGDILVQFRSNENEPEGTVLWKGQKYFLEEFTGSN